MLTETLGFAYRGLDRACARDAFSSCGPGGVARKPARHVPPSARGAQQGARGDGRPAPGPHPFASSRAPPVRPRAARWAARSARTPRSRLPSTGSGLPSPQECAPTARTGCGRPGLDSGKAARRRERTNDRSRGSAHVAGVQAMRAWAAPPASSPPVRLTCGPQAARRPSAQPGPRSTLHRTPGRHGPGLDPGKAHRTLVDPFSAVCSTGMSRR